jgi:hypothetical protein
MIFAARGGNMLMTWSLCSHGGMDISNAGILFESNPDLGALELGSH